MKVIQKRKILLDNIFWSHKSLNMKPQRGNINRKWKMKIIRASRHVAIPSFYPGDKRWKLVLKAIVKNHLKVIVHNWQLNHSQKNDSSSERSRALQCRGERK